mgnify:CR=1 FL=1
MCMAAALPMAGGYFLGKAERKDETIAENRNFSGFEEEKAETESPQQSTAPTGTSHSSSTTEKAY